MFNTNSNANSMFITETQSQQGNLSTQGYKKHKQSQYGSQNPDKPTTMNEQVTKLQHDIKNLEKRINENSPRTMEAFTILQLRPDDIRFKTQQEYTKQYDKNTYIPYLEQVKSNIRHVAFERRKLIKQSTESIKYDNLPFASLDYSEHKFKPINVRHSATNLDRNYTPKNVQSFDYQVDRMKKREERQNKAKLNALIDMFKIEFKKRQYEENVQKNEQDFQKRKEEIQKKQMKDIKKKNKKASERTKKHQDKMKEKEEDYEEFMERYNEKQEERMERFYDRKEREREEKLKHKQMLEQQVLGSMGQRIQQVQQREENQRYEMKQNLEEKLYMSQLFYQQELRNKQQRLRYDNLMKSKKFEQQKMVKEQQDYDKVQQLGQYFQSSQLLQDKREKDIKKQLKERKKKLAEKEKKFNQNQERNRDRMEYKEDKAKEKMEKKLEQISELEYRRQQLEIQRRKEGIEKQQKHLHSLSQKNFTLALKADDVQFKNMERTKKINQIKQDKYDVKQMSLGNTLKANQETLFLDQELLKIKDLNKEQLLKKIKQLNLDEAEFAQFFPKQQEEEEEIAM